MQNAFLIPRRTALFGGLCLCCARPAGAAPLPFAQIAPGLHIRAGVTADATAANADAIANIGFVIGNNGVAVLDPGGSLDDGEALRRAIRATTPLPIRAVILTHIHPDHIFGAAAFLPDHPQFISHAGLPDALAARGEYYRAGLEKILGPGRAGTPVTPTRLVATTDRIDLGGRVLELTAHKPAHTHADLSVLDRRTNTLFTGDLLFVGRTPSLDGNLAGWLAELGSLARNGATRAIPGHGPASVAWPADAAPIRRYLAALQRDTRQAIAQGVPIEQAAARIAPAERAQWALFDDYHPRNVIEAYRQIEWE